MLTTVVGLSAASSIQAATFGGDVTVVTDYIYRGISENDGRPAAQFDLHAGADNGLFAGLWGTTLNARGTPPVPPPATMGPAGDFEIQPYVGMRFPFSSNWSATVSAVDYVYLHSEYGASHDYQELSVAVQYLDGLTVSLAASPNAVHYWRGFRVGRYESYDASVSGEWPLLGPFSLTAGAGYYYLAGPSSHTAVVLTAMGPQSVTTHWGTQGYSYGNIGLAAEYCAWRVDVGYYFSDKQSENLFPYSGRNNRAAAALSWRF